MIVIQRLRRFSSTRWYFYSLQKLSEWKIFVFFFLRVFRCRGGKMRIFFAFFLPIFTRLPGYYDTMKVKSVLFLLVPARFFLAHFWRKVRSIKKKDRRKESSKSVYEDLLRYENMFDIFTGLCTKVRVKPPYQRI